MSEIANKIKNKYPDKVPIYLFNKDIKEIEGKRNKFIINKSMTLGTFLNCLRTIYKLNQFTSIFLYICSYKNSKTKYDIILPLLFKTIDSIYSEYSNSDGFLYLYVCLESVFG